MSENITFDRYVNFGTHTAVVFRRKFPRYKYDYRGRAVLSHEMVLDRPSLEARINNLKSSGYDTKESEFALINWPKE